MVSTLITLTTDFGAGDPFAGIMKGVIFGINRAAHVIDLSHGIPPQDIRAAALVLRHSLGYFPGGTIHVVVVDPGVGSERRPLLVESEDQFLVGPDNGLFSLALADRAIRRIIHLSNRTYHLQPTSATFHGRDIFAPVAAHLSLGTPAMDLGEDTKDLMQLCWPRLVRAGGAIYGEIIYIDRFGNLITNISERDLIGHQPDKIEVRFGEVCVSGLAASYANAGGSRYLALINSWGLLEIAVYRDNAQRRSQANIGDKVEVALA